MSDAPPVLCLHVDDNVGVVLDHVTAGTQLAIEDRRLAAAGDIPQGHKVALQAIADGGDVRKYGVVIGRATAAIRAGEHVHVHNIESTRLRGDR